jgi:branched-subunit amino acid transport protein
MSHEPAWVWGLILGMAAASLFVRGIFVLPGHRLRLRPGVERVLRYAPAAALMAVVVPGLTGTTEIGSLTLSPRLLAGLAGFAVAWFTRNIILTIVVGMAVLYVAGWALG